MLNSISINNFKSLEKIDMQFSNFNLITGTNSSGKSSLFQAILIASQRNGEDLLNGNAISLGKKKNVINENVDRDGCCQIKYVFDGKNSLIGFGEERDNEINCDKSLFLFENNLYYLSANRLGVKDVYPKNSERNLIFGRDGDFIFDYFVRHQNDKIEDSFSSYLSKGERKTLNSVVNHWLERLSGYRVLVRDLDDTNVIQISFYKGALNEMTTKYRPQHVGTGVTYILEQLIVGLASKANDIILVENPELHLHPSAQHDLNNFYYWLSQKNRQIFIETHSDHFFNGMRVIKSHNLESSTKVFFFHQIENVTNVVEVEMGEFGIIDNMKEDLFDQFDKDLTRMLVRD
ncbi:DUF3696 domain-containing protein [Enterococcus casseliflavus]|uniref:DUF3696 domain-containing protein n=1 Tax=Enterococcus casseliflavus TaxID=37734 RepID=UPI00119CC328|nr:DUF3696 domain-containing protein [Enterococcus casseliflavus]